MRRLISRADFLIFLLLMSLSALPAAQAAEQRTGNARTWADIKAGIKKGLPSKYEEARTNITRLKIVRRPPAVLSAYEADQELWNAVTRFYSFIKGRELDVYYEQPGIPDFFPDRNTYYDFLDTMLPAMRDRRFERNRLLEYQVHDIKPAPDDPAKVEVLMSITSDDVLPFKKIMVFRQQWLIGPAGWYPGKVSAEPATYWERIR